MWWALRNVSNTCSWQGWGEKLTCVVIGLSREEGKEQLMMWALLGIICMVATCKQGSGAPQHSMSVSLTCCCGQHWLQVNSRTATSSHIFRFCLYLFSDTCFLLSPPLSCCTSQVWPCWCRRLYFVCCAGLSLISHTSAELCSLALRFLFHDARKHGLESHPVGMEWIRYVEEAQRCSLGFSLLMLFGVHVQLFHHFWACFCSEYHTCY